MDRHRTLAVLSGAQLGAGLAGFVLAGRRRHAYDVPLMHGSRDHVLRDSFTMGTALSAPMPMLATQALATAELARGPSERAVKALGVLGAMMVPGYFMERLTRDNLREGAWDSAELRLAVTGAALAAAMTGFAAGSSRGRRRRTSPPSSPPP